MRKLCAFAGPFSAAVFAALFLLPERFWLPVGLCCGLGALAGMFFRGDGRLRCILTALGLSAGLLWLCAYTALFHTGAEALAGSEETVEAVAADWPGKLPTAAQWRCGSARRRAEASRPSSTWLPGRTGAFPRCVPETG